MSFYANHFVGASASGAKRRGHQVISGATEFLYRFGDTTSTYTSTRDTSGNGYDLGEAAGESNELPEIVGGSVSQTLARSFRDSYSTRLYQSANADATIKNAFLADAWTIVARVLVRDGNTGGYYTFGCHGPSSSAGNNTIGTFRIQGGLKLGANWAHAGGAQETNFQQSDGDTITLHEWTDVAVVKKPNGDGWDIEFWIGGVLQDTIFTELQVVDNGADYRVTLGSRFWNSTGPGFDGRIQNVGFFDAALTGAQIADYTDYGSEFDIENPPHDPLLFYPCDGTADIEDISDHRRHMRIRSGGSLQLADSLIADEDGGLALAMPGGTDDFARMWQDEALREALDGEWTCQFWARFPPSVYTVDRGVLKYSSTEDATEVEENNRIFGVEFTDGYAPQNTTQSGGGNANTYTDDALSGTDRFSTHHFAVIKRNKSATEMTFEWFVDGVSQGESANQTRGDGGTAFDTDLTLGGAHAIDAARAFENFHGWLESVALYSTIRDAADIAADAAAGTVLP